MRIFVGAALLAVCVGALAGEPVKLQGLKVSGPKATGTCGAATVSVEGVGPDFIDYSGRVEVVSGKTKLVLSGEDGTFFQDWNTLACVETPSGAMLVARASCGGSSCNPDDFRVVDPKFAAVVSKGTPEDGCSYQCAEKALGQRLPDGLRPAYAE